MAVHIIVGILVGLIYLDVGDEATKVYSNLGHIYFDQLFLMFTALMATILTCTYQKFFYALTIQLVYCFFFSPFRNACVD